MGVIVKDRTQHLGKCGSCPERRSKKVLTDRQDSKVHKHRRGTHGDKAGCLYQAECPNVGRDGSSLKVPRHMAAVSQSQSAPSKAILQN